MVGHQLRQARERLRAAPAVASEHDQAGVHAARHGEQAVGRCSFDADDRRILSGDVEHVRGLLCEGLPEGGIRSPRVCEDDTLVMGGRDVRRDHRGVAILGAPGSNQDHAGEAELRAPAGHEGRHGRALGNAPMAMGADHQQAGAACGVQERAADVLLMSYHGAGLDAVGVGGGARGLNRLCGMPPSRVAASSGLSR